MVLGLGDRLSVSITARTRDFVEGVADARNKALELAGGLQVLQGRADEAADEIDDAKRSALFASGAFSSLAITSEGLAFSLGSVSSSLTALLLPILFLAIPAVLSLATAFGTVIVAASALAVGLAAVPLLGVIGHTKELKVALQNVKDELLTLTKPLRDRFFQVLLQIIHDLPELTRRILDATGGAERLGDMFLKLWAIAKRVIPQIAGFVVDLAIKAFPHLVNVIEWLEEHGPAIWREMMAVTKELWPVLRGLFITVARNLPVWIEFGTHVLKLVDGPLKFLMNSLTGIATVLNGIFNLMERLGLIDGSGGPILPQKGLFSGADQPKGGGRAGRLPGTVNIENIFASGRQEGREAGKALARELGAHNLKMR